MKFENLSDLKKSELNLFVNIKCSLKKSALGSNMAFLLQKKNSSQNLLFEISVIEIFNI